MVRRGGSSGGGQSSQQYQTPAPAPQSTPYTPAYSSSGQFYGGGGGGGSPKENVVGTPVGTAIGGGQLIATGGGRATSQGGLTTAQRTAISQSTQQQNQSRVNQQTSFKPKTNKVLSKSSFNTYQSQTPQQQVSQRQKLRPRERLKEAYRSASGGEPFFSSTKPFNLRGSYRGFEELVSIGGEKVLPDRFTNPYKARVTKSTFFEDVAITSFISGPTFTTTSQITKELGSVSKVGIAGVTQQTTGNTIKTQAGFKLFRAGRSVTGVAESQTKIINNNIGLTATRGSTFKTGYVFPTGNKVTTAGQRFKSVEVSQFRQKGGFVFSRGYGQTGATRDTGYASASVGKLIRRNQKTYLAQIGVSNFQQGGSVSASILKKSSKLKSNNQIFISSPSGSNLGLQQVKQSSLQRTVNKAVAIGSVRSSIGSQGLKLIPPKNVINPRPITNLKGFSQATVKPTSNTITKQSTGQISGQNFSPLKQNFTPLNLNLAKQDSGQRQKSKPAQIQKTEQSQVQQQKPLQIQKPTQIQKQIPLTLQVQKQSSGKVNRIFKPTRIKTRISEKPMFPFSFGRGQSKSKQGSNKYPVLVRRFGKFKVVGFGATPKQALEIGRSKTARTLGATFKVPGIKATNVYGFKTKVSKKEGLVFIEQPKYRLSKSSELKEIQMFRQRKGGLF